MMWPWWYHLKLEGQTTARCPWGSIFAEGRHGFRWDVILFKDGLCLLDPFCHITSSGACHIMLGHAISNETRCCQSSSLWPLFQRPFVFLLRHVSFGSCSIKSYSHHTKNTYFFQENKIVSWLKEITREHSEKNTIISTEAYAPMPWQSSTFTFSSWLLAMAVILDKLCLDASAPDRFTGASL